MREAERAVIERLLGLHPTLARATIVEPEKDPPDAIVVCDSVRYGFELTDIFSVGDTNAGGSEYLQFSRRWQALKKELIETLEHRNANLDQCDI